MIYQCISVADYEYDHPYTFEHPSGPSFTRPDEALTIREIYERYARGMPLDVVQRTGYYEDSLDPLDDIDNPDLVDFWSAQQELSRDLQKEEEERLAAEAQARDDAALERARQILAQETIEEKS